MNSILIRLFGLHTVETITRKMTAMVASLHTMAEQRIAIAESALAEVKRLEQHAEDNLAEARKAKGVAEKIAALVA
jgi:hypothetical protein